MSFGKAGVCRCGNKGGLLRRLGLSAQKSLRNDEHTQQFCGFLEACVFLWRYIPHTRAKCFALPSVLLFGQIWLVYLFCGGGGLMRLEHSSRVASRAPTSWLPKFGRSRVVRHGRVGDWPCFSSRTYELRFVHCLQLDTCCLWKHHLSPK